MEDTQIELECQKLGLEVTQHLNAVYLFEPIKFYDRVYDPVKTLSIFQKLMEAAGCFYLKCDILLQYV